VGCACGKLAELGGPTGHGPLEQAGEKRKKGRRRKGKGVGCLEAFSPKRFREQEILFHFSNPFYNLQTNFNSNQI
jgi:hypothetical protein